jgi:hypothetical protein
MSNPLQKFFRQPAIYISLPSGGKFWPTGTIDLGDNGQLAVLPMTARDELTLKTPDALMSGKSVVDVIKSCIPQIKDPWQMPAMDIDYVLVAIRVASYGENMEMTAKCPKCSEDSPYEVELPALLDSIRCPDYSEPLRLQDLAIFLKPQTYRQVNDASQRMYQEQRVLSTVNNSDLSEEQKLEQFKSLFEKLTATTLAAVASHVSHIQAEESDVLDPRHIGEFLDNAPKKVYSQVEEYIKQVNDVNSTPKATISCGDCNNTFTVPIQFDYSAFFG